MEFSRTVTKEQGKSNVLVYDVFPGMYVMKVSYRIKGFMEERKKSDKMEINFCVGGRFECAFTERDIVVMRPGDMAASMFDGENGKKSWSDFPMGFYEGLSIITDCDEAERWMRQSLGIFAVDMHTLKCKLFSDHWYMAREAGFGCEHVFREIYDEIDHKPQRFMQLKVVELLMLLEELPAGNCSDSYFPKGQIELIKHIRDHIISDSNYYTSIQQLASDHGLSAPQLQRLFREVYGMPVYRYLKEYRLEQAAVDLISTDRSVTELAMEAGFSNVSKFSENFKKRYGMTPTAYRSTMKCKACTVPIS